MIHCFNLSVNALPLHSSWFCLIGFDTIPPKSDFFISAFGKLKHSSFWYFYLSHGFRLSSSSPVLEKNFRNVLQPIRSQFDFLNYIQKYVFKTTNNEIFIVCAVIRTRSLQSGIHLEIKMPRHTLSRTTWAAKKGRGCGGKQGQTVKMSRAPLPQRLLG